MANGTLLKKKLLLLEEENSRSQNDSNNNKSRLTEDAFSDTCQSDDQIPVFGSTSGSIGQTVRDQFAVALLRLQTDLEATSQRLVEMESKLEEWTRKTRSQARPPTSAKPSKGIFTKDNVYNIAYLGWPVLVYLAMRAIERRSLNSSRLA